RGRRARRGGSPRALRRLVQRGPPPPRARRLARGGVGLREALVAPAGRPRRQDPREHGGAPLARLHPHLHRRPPALPRAGRRRPRAPPPAADRAAPAVGPHALTLAERYLALAFRVGRHEPT